MIVAFLMLLLFVPLMAQDVEPGGDMDMAKVLEILTPLIVFGAGWLVKKFKPSIPGWATMLVVGALSAAVTWITNLVGNPDLGIFLQFAYGLVSTFIHQLSVQFSAKKRMADSG